MLRTRLPLLSIVCGLLLSVGCAEAGDSADKLMLPAKFRKLLPLHTKLGKPKPGEWLAEHEESGQTFRQYVAVGPVKPTKGRNVIYIQPLGDFTKTQRKILDLTTEFMGIYFDLPVKVREGLPLSEIPAKAQRTHPTWGDKQILSTYVLYDVLKPRLPKDACVSLALTASDLWPGKGWNFVFGQASLRERVGVWSIYRNGDPDESDASFLLCLRRTIKTATHETGHMFSMKHCTAYECNMCGSNHRVESDSQPQALCPHCLAKLCYATGADPRKRYEKLIAFCKANGLDTEQAFFEKSLAVFSPG
ncbi:MAG: Zn-dependent protease [Candidatus Nealsonbacteria bacterium]|nr:Zn-dependent protease [Candidatus Nealsonbacteria bacterium]